MSEGIAKIRLAAVGARYEAVIESLKGQGIAVAEVEDNTLLSESTSAHADMAVFSFGDGTVVADCGRELLLNRLYELGLSVHRTEKQLGGVYPNDVALNCFVVCDTLVCNSRYVDKGLLHEAKKRGYGVCHVNQGYAKCSTLVVSNSALITDDVSIFDACSALGADCLLIEKGDVFLDGKHYGFIGGASCMLSSCLSAFLGSLELHRNGENIKRFLRKHSVDYIQLTPGRLTDIGGIVSL